ncbi:MAG: hypothetical protein P1P76_06940 [Anaerolineales bacterium]|nr:hypothetical protein [Anaerolineales bacterium]
MHNHRLRFLHSLFFLAVGLIVGCSPSASPAVIVERYLEAIADKDVVAAANLSCLTWEEDAYAEASSFETVEVRLEDVSCQVDEGSDEYQLVTCGGEIVANYGGEDQNIPLASREFYVIEEGGAWRMCGYSAP